MEQGRLDEVTAQLGSMLDSFNFELPGYRAMRAGALAQAGRLAEASDELDRVGGGAPSGEVERLIGHAPMAIRHVSEVCRRLSDQERATKLHAQVTPWAGQILVGGWGEPIEGASDRIGHLLACFGRFDDADAPTPRRPGLHARPALHRSSLAPSTGMPDRYSSVMRRAIENSLARSSTMLSATVAEHARGCWRQAA